MPVIAVAQQTVSGCDHPFLWLCLVIPPEQNGGIFGFAEFVQAFALLVLIYTLSDVRYRFRVETAPIPLLRLTFWLSGVIGAGTLITDVWFAQQYPLPSFLVSRALWQAAFGLLFLSLVIIWLWFAYVRPPGFSKHNSLNYTRVLYRYLLQGADSDLPAVADELGRSAKSIIACARELPHRGSAQTEENRERKPTAADYANDLLLLIGNRKFCRHIVASAPGTAILFFRAMTELKKYRLPIGQFASNLSSESLTNKDSLLYHEDEGYYSGLFGYVRPFTNAVYGNFHLVESLAEGTSPLDINLQVRCSFDAELLEAYTRAVLTTFESALKEDQWHQHSYSLCRAFGAIQHSSADVYKLNDVPAHSDSEDIRARLDVVVRFINKAIDLLDKHGVHATTIRRHDERHKWREDYYDHLANMMFEVISSASSVKGPGFESWSIQHNAVWSEFFGFHESKTRSIILFKLRRLLYEEILVLEKWPNFKSAPILGLCLNVMGLGVGLKRDHTRGEYQLRKAVISWTRRKYLGLVQQQHKVAAACLVGEISFDAENKRLVKTYIEGLNLEAPKDYLDLIEPAEPVK